MRLQSSAAFWAILASASPLGIDAKRGLRRQLASNECTIMAAEALSVTGGEDPDMILECELDPDDADGISGISVPIEATQEQLNALRGMIESGKVNPGRDRLNTSGAKIDGKGVRFPPGLDIANEVRKNNMEDVGRRRLAVTKGDLKMLLVKVTDGGNLAVADTPTFMSDEVFGTGVDVNNLKSGLEACSWKQLNVVVGNNDPNEVAQGVIEVNIGISLTNNTRSAIRNAVTTAVQTKLGYSLPGPFNYVLYSLQGCYVDCGWAAYAYVNSWNSIYQGNYYKQPGVLIHEIGHNFNLAHSGGLNNSTYTDHTCSMGNPHYSDEGFQCFNPAKNFQLNWYNPAKITEDPRVNGYTKTLTLVGIGEYNLTLNAPIATATSANMIYPVTVKLETGGGADYFVGFNRATGPNYLNDEGDNEVTIIQVDGNDGVGYSQSYLRARLLQGQSHNLYNFGGTGKTVTITVNTIDIATSPGTAVVTITDNMEPPPPTPVPTNSPTNLPTNPPPTPVPTNSPTNLPTNPPPTPVPTAPPTNAPTTPPPPTNPPTLPPTPPPVASVSKYVCAKNEPLSSTICVDGQEADATCSSVNFRSGCGNGGKVCWWASGCTAGPPTPTPPTPTPPSPTPPTGGCAFCLPINGDCCGTCIDYGKPSGRGCF